MEPSDGSVWHICGRKVEYGNANLIKVSLNFFLFLD